MKKIKLAKHQDGTKQEYNEADLDNMMDVWEDEEEDTNKLVLRVIFATLKAPPAMLNQITSNNLNILDMYWSKEDNLQVDE